MPDPIVATDPTAFTMASGTLGYIVLRTLYDIKKWMNMRNGNNPHPTKEYVDSIISNQRTDCSGKIESIFRKVDAMRDSHEKFEKTMIADVSVLKSNVERIDKKLDRMS